MHTRLVEHVIEAEQVQELSVVPPEQSRKDERGDRRSETHPTHVPAEGRVGYEETRPTKAAILRRRCHLLPPEAQRGSSGLPLGARTVQVLRSIDSSDARGSILSFRCEWASCDFAVRMGLCDLPVRIGLV